MDGSRWSNGQVHNSTAFPRFPPSFFQDEGYLFNSSRFTFLPSYFLRSFHRGYFLFPWLPFFHGMM